MQKRDQVANLRVVGPRGDLLLPRRYAQSTSGRTDSTGTCPPLSRSSAMAVDSAIRCLAEMAFRKYPTVVPQRFAYDSCASGESELRYARSRSALTNSSDMPETLPYGKGETIPFSHSTCGRRSYDIRMAKSAKAEIRRRRLRLLITELGSQKAVADICGFPTDNYVTQLLNPKKSFGEKTARKIEVATRKPEGWLEEDALETPPPPPWPFNFDRTLWDRLSLAKQRDVEIQFQRLILGALVEDAAVPPGKQRPA